MILNGERYNYIWALGVVDRVDMRGRQYQKIK